MIIRTYVSESSLNFLMLCTNSLRLLYSMEEVVEVGATDYMYISDNHVTSSFTVLD